MVRWAVQAPCMSYLTPFPCHPSWILCKAGRIAHLRVRQPNLAVVVSHSPSFYQHSFGCLWEIAWSLSCSLLDYSAFSAAFNLVIAHPSAIPRALRYTFTVRLRRTKRAMCLHRSILSNLIAFANHRLIFYPRGVIPFHQIEPRLDWVDMAEEILYAYWSPHFSFPCSRQSACCTRLVVIHAPDG